MLILLNGVNIEIESTVISYESIVAMTGRDPQKTFTVLYSSEKNQGSLVAGKECFIESGMIFNVLGTSNA